MHIRSRVLLQLVLNVFCVLGCANDFRYIPEEARGTFQLSHTSGINLTICLELGIPGKPEGPTSLKLAYGIDIIEKRLRRGVPIRYFARLPRSQPPLSIVKIVQNGEVFCENIKTVLGMNVFSITHTLLYPNDGLTILPVSLSGNGLSPTSCPLNVGCKSCNKNVEELNSVSGVDSLKIVSGGEEAKCGIASIQVRLDREDHTASIGEWPWMAEVYKYTELETSILCSAILISTQHVLTAAHCFSATADNVLVILGQHNIHEWHNRNVVIRKPTKIVHHIDYDESIFEADLAVVSFKRVSFTEFIRPTCLWDQNIEIDDMLNVPGLLVIREYDRLSMVTKTPLVTNMTLIKKKTCKEALKNKVKLTSGSFCGRTNADDIVYKPVAAGGLYFNVNNQWHLRGIVWDRRKDIADEYADGNVDVFTDVWKYLPWIKAQLK